MVLDQKEVTLINSTLSSCWQREIRLCGIGLESGIRLLVLGGRNCAVIDYVNWCNTSLHLIGW